MSGVILMYHRVAPKAHARPWFARGTAVTPEAFELQMRWLVETYEVVPLPSLLERVAVTEGRPADRVLAAVTFDDGYRDVAEYAEPICRELGIVGAVFPCLAPLGSEPSPLWFDELYALLDAQLGGAALENAEIEGRSLAEWVRGDLKERLQAAAPTARRKLLDEVAQRWNVAGAPTPAYLSMSDLEDLVARGWSVGGHGVAHTRLTSLADAEVVAELRASLELVRRCRQRVAILAYPDGAHDAGTRQLAVEVGFARGLTVQPGTVDSRSRSMEIPRYFCRGDGERPHESLPR